MPFKKRFKSRLSFIAILLAGAVCIISPASWLYAQSALTTAASQNKIVPVLELRGNAYNRGLQHGKALKKEIADVFDKWKLNIQAAVKGNPDSTLKVFMGSTNFLPITEKYIPDILKEVRGIADGSGQKMEDVLAFQLVDEFWVYLNKQSNTENHHCSGIGVAATATHPAYIAQNMDLENYMHGFQVLFHMEATSTAPEQYILSCAGLVGLNGMNGKGIGLCMNTLMELKASTDGLPVAFIIRAVLNMQSGEEALQFLKTVKHASGQNYILGIKDSVYDFEASSNQVVRYMPIAGDNRIVYHTNHALANHDVKEWYKESHVQVAAVGGRANNSKQRFVALEQRLNTPVGAVSAEVIKSILQSKDDADNPVCRAWLNDGKGFTFSSVLFTLGGNRSVQLTYGPPDQASYKTYFFKAAN